MNKQKNNELELLPKLEKYIQYVIEIIIKLPRTEKYSIDTEYKISLYRLLNYAIYLNKIERAKRLSYANFIDTEINTQRIYLRIMKKTDG